LRRRRTAALLLLLIALAAPGLLSSSCGSGQPLQPPSAAHPLGTDPVGRDAACVAVLGAAPSIEAGAAAAGAALLVLLSSTAAAMHRWARRVLGFIAALVAGLPRMSLFLLLALVARLPPWGIGALVGVLAGLNGARSVAARAGQVASEPYVEAARAVGAPGWRILLRHIVPNTWEAIASYASMASAAAVYAEAGLSMLGLGDASRPSWGMMINLVLTTPGALLTQAGLLQALAGLALIAVAALLFHEALESAAERPPQ
jgi:peptide/nickel transport system permease protein